MQSYEKNIALPIFKSKIRKIGSLYHDCETQPTILFQYFCIVQIYTDNTRLYNCIRDYIKLYKP